MSHWLPIMAEPKQIPYAYLDGVRTSRALLMTPRLTICHPDYYGLFMSEELCRWERQGLVYSDLYLVCVLSDYCTMYLTSLYLYQDLILFKMTKNVNLIQICLFCTWQHSVAEENVNGTYHFNTHCHAAEVLWVIARVLLGGC